MGRYEDISSEIIGLVERRMRQMYPELNKPADGNAAKTLLNGKNYSLLQAEVARKLAELTNLKHNCINCENLNPEQWTCREQVVNDIRDPFEERSKCIVWKPAEHPTSHRPFPACTPEYEFFVWDEKEGKLIDNFGRVITADRDRDVKEKKEGKSFPGEL